MEQPFLETATNQYHRIDKEGWGDCYAYELVTPTSVLFIPNNAVDYLYDQTTSQFYELAYEKSSVWVGGKEHRITGLHIGGDVEPKIPSNQIQEWMRERSREQGTDILLQLRTQFGEFFAKRKLHPVLQQAVQTIEESNGRISVEMLQDELKFSYSQRQIERIFTQLYGYGPKRYARYVRLQAAVCAVVASVADGRRIASLYDELGYADASHFYREFRTYMKMTPRQFQDFLWNETQRQ